MLEEYAEIKAKKQADSEAAAKAKFEAQIAKEEAKYAKEAQKAETKCQKKGIAFDAEQFRLEFILQSKHIIKQNSFAEMYEQRETAKAEKIRENQIAEIEKVNKRLEKIKVRI